jgi:hypothetical protein
VPGAIVHGELIHAALAAQPIVSALKCNPARRGRSGLAALGRPESSVPKDYDSNKLNGSF